MANNEGKANNINKINGNGDFSKHPPGIGLALGGGMARGFAHIGVLNVLNRHGIVPSVVAGTSIGALVGGCYLAGKLKDFEQWAFSLNRMKILSYLDFRVRSGGLIGGKKLFSLMEQNFGGMKIEDLPCPFVTIASDLATGHEVWIKEGDLVTAMKASFALPGVFSPVQYDDRLLVDGALLNPLPVSVLQALGARMTIAVDLQGDMIGKAAKPGQAYPTVAGFDMFNDDDVPRAEQDRINNSMTRRLFKRDTDTPSLFGNMISAIGIMQDRLTRTRLAGDPPDIHIKPLIGHIGLMEFEKASELIAEGEAAAVRALPEIKEAIRVLLPHKK
jgi:NTE family protein